MADYPRDAAQLMVPLARADQLTAGERDGILARCRKTGMVIYALASGDIADKGLVRRLGQAFGLERLDGNLCADHDGISSVQIMEAGRHRDYIPYTDRRLNWHTDGYYNAPDRQIRAVLMHCVMNAEGGGENGLLDHEMVYLHLRDTNPLHVEALMQPDAMTIPANVENGRELRPAQTGPVFSIDPGTGALHMRYTARSRSIAWKKDRATQAAAAALAELVADGAPFVFRYRLAPGQGILCNNVLHCRTAFRDDAAAGHQRLLYRARFYERIRGTGPAECVMTEERTCSG
ncbi:MAG TPA: TauD/TfdA family dioxygenase [Gammaproteobacteria bacterium]|nr:TauD/TfdA family dioxygenase [Gammaproteobacteria bacterium]